MNDRYLFRAKRIDNGEWVEGFYCKRKTGHYDNIGFHDEYKDCIIAEFSDGGITWCDVDPYTLCACTGLNDKNGKKIWENDVVYMRCNGLSGYGNVIYENGCFWIDDKKRGRKYPFSNNDVKYRVDGNVFDNPELLSE